MSYSHFCNENNTETELKVHFSFYFFKISFIIHYEFILFALIYQFNNIQTFGNIWAVMEVLQFIFYV